MIPPGFGENEIMQMCERFNLSHSHTLTVNGYRDYLDNGGRKIPADLEPLVHCTHVIPCSTAECERGFSMMNIIVTDTRNKLLISHVSNLLFIKLHGPLCSRYSNKSCLSKGNHRRSSLEIVLILRTDCIIAVIELCTMYSSAITVIL